MLLVASISNFKFKKKKKTFLAHQYKNYLLGGASSSPLGSQKKGHVTHTKEVFFGNNGCSHILNDFQKQIARSRQYGLACQQNITGFQILSTFLSDLQPNFGESPLVDDSQFTKLNKIYLLCSLICSQISESPLVDDSQFDKLKKWNKPYSSGMRGVNRRVF
jgi:hypothetical protein